MIKFIKNKLREFIRASITSEFQKINTAKNNYSEQAFFNPKNVRIDSQALLSNHRNDIHKIIIGNNSWIQGELMTFKHGGEIIIGEYTFIGMNSKISSAKKITIGNRVLISHNVNIHDNVSHPINSIQRHEDFKHIMTIGLQDNLDLREAEIFIEDDVWIGFNVTVMKGVKIGRGAIIGACTLITKDVPEYAVVIGNPARILKYVD